MSSGVRTTDDADRRLFAYGTLAPGRPNAHVLAGIDGTWQAATMSGRLLEHGWGAPLGYPVLVLDDDGPDVGGFLLISDELPSRWEELDEFEGSEYVRVSATAHTETGVRVLAQVYVLAELQPDQ